MAPRWTFRSAALLSLMALGACAGATTITRIDYDPFYSPDVVRYLTQNGKMATVVRGTPVGSAKVANAESVATTLKSPGWFPRFQFTTRPDPDTRTDYRIVLVFNPVHPAPGGPAVCESNGDLPVKTDTTQIRVQAAFCYKGDAITQLFAQGPAVESLDDPRFDSFMRQTIATLLPQRNTEPEPPETAGPNWWN